jgi:hypothetical protein
LRATTKQRPPQEKSSMSGIDADSLPMSQSKKQIRLESMNHAPGIPPLKPFP